MERPACHSSRVEYLEGNSHSVMAAGSHIDQARHDGHFQLNRRRE